MNLCFATNNQHKIKEVWHMLPPDFRILSLSDIGCFEELPETKETLEDNSLQKAEFVYHYYKIPCFADDTGLEVETLGGSPGVYSARYAGPQKNSDDNIHLLLKNLSGHSNRKAQFRTVITLVGIEESPVSFEGTVRGKIITEKRGTSGFGYDPVFVPDGFSQTFAEMDVTDKNKLSHRGEAFKKLVSYLRTTQLNR